MFVSLLVIAVGAALIIDLLSNDGMKLVGPLTSETLGVSFKIPEGWFVAHSAIAPPSGNPEAGIVMADSPLAGGAPTDRATLVIGMRVIDPADTFGVPANCHPRIADGPQATFQCMARLGYLTPTYRDFNTAWAKGALLPGTLPPTRASYPMIVLPVGSRAWLAVIITDWRGHPDARHVLEAVARSVRP